MTRSSCPNHWTLESKNRQKGGVAWRIVRLSDSILLLLNFECPCSLFFFWGDLGFKVWLLGELSNTALEPGWCTPVGIIEIILQSYGGIRLIFLESLYIDPRSCSTILFVSSHFLKRCKFVGRPNQPLTVIVLCWLWTLCVAWEPSDLVLYEMEMSYFDIQKTKESDAVNNETIR